jgi:hypothetical protein|tara:strand:+ start:473 stop:670 length:198 start_codon:yes stop_codon:yes gene_type:complete
MQDRFEITDKEYTAWKDTEEVSEDIIKLIAKTIIYRLPLHRYEWDIFSHDTERINNKIKNYKDEY